MKEPFVLAFLLRHDDPSFSTWSFQLTIPRMQPHRVHAYCSATVSERPGLMAVRGREVNLWSCLLWFSASLFLFALTPVLPVPRGIRLVKLEHALHHQSVQTLVHVTTMEQIR